MEKVMLTKEQAIEIMKQSTSIEDWDSRREALKSMTTPEVISEIDVSGLSVKVLGQDMLPKKGFQLRKHPDIDSLDNPQIL